MHAPHEHICISTYTQKNQNQNQIIHDSKGASSGYRAIFLTSRNNSCSDINCNHSDSVTLNCWLFENTKLF